MKAIRKLFKKYRGIKSRGIYAVTAGQYLGQFFVFINTETDVYEVLSMPDNIPMKINKKDIEEGLKNNILDYIETLPKNVYEIACAEYVHRVNKLKEGVNESLNRRQQPTSSGTLDQQE